MPARLRSAAAAAAAAIALVGMIVVVINVRADRNGVGHLGFASTRPAAAPFAEFTEARVAVGSTCLRVLVASTIGLRSQGLRDVRSLAPYDGMLFVNPHDTTAPYTMAGTPMPLAITFFSAAGAPVDHLRMTPCPHGSDANCPEYESRGPYRYALERPATSVAGSGAGSGSLGACG